MNAPTVPRRSRKKPSGLRLATSRSIFENPSRTRMGVSDLGGNGFSPMKKEYETPACANADAPMPSLSVTPMFDSQPMVGPAPGSGPPGVVVAGVVVPGGVVPGVVVPGVVVGGGVGGGGAGAWLEPAACCPPDRLACSLV